MLLHPVPELNGADQEHALDAGEPIADRLWFLEVRATNGRAAIGEVRQGLRRAREEHDVAGVQPVKDELRRLAAKVARCTGDGNDHAILRHS